MTDTFTIACPCCDLKLRCQPTACGKRLQCPGCQSWMMVPNLPAPDHGESLAELVFPTGGRDESAADVIYPSVNHEESLVEVIYPANQGPRPRSRNELDDFTDLGGGYNQFPPPPRPRRRKADRKKKSKRNWVMPTTITVCVVMGLLLLGALVYGVMRQFTVEALDVEEPLAYLTVDTEMITVIRMNELRRDPAFEDALGRAPGADDYEKLLKSVGLESDDVSTIAIGMGSFEDARDFGTILQNGGMLLVESSKKVNRFRLSMAMQRATHAGKGYLRDRTKTMGILVAVFFPNEYSFIAGSEPTIQKLLEIRPPSISDSRYAFADFQSSAVVAFAPRWARAVPHSTPNDGQWMVQEITRAASILDARVERLAVCFKFDEGIAGAAYAVCRSSREADGLAAMLIQSPNKQQDLAEHLIGPRRSRRLGARDEAARNLRISTAGPTVVVSTRVGNR